MTLPKVIAATAIVIATMSGSAFAQEGRVYVFHSKAAGGCPGLDWHVVQGAGGSLSGMIAWDDMKSMARATGTVVNQQVKMTATEVGGQNRTATVDGRATPGGFAVNIKGPNFECKGITIPFYTGSAGTGG
jgi:hypothetical protein